MLVMLMEEQIIACQQVCQSCLMADRSGQPRWRHGQLCCGNPVAKLGESQAEQFECQMGFRVVNIH